ncbi:hydroxyacylglutathione hydrolase [Shewanella litorisediminis]|uniref:Hydroxyacylglutathione hydrolase n=1 Tax=Shewanella litorisediminis TaxID=1173586 RepID=A0ABX7FYR6_9GAMM|nr:hydroxyacylglutathione hydrolase [Shewanella litorisediminis]MCL2918859.1 hydroxyacylglutathione hydrolase [Shewanella litorisediminis]QRH00175.1 hydroxyacylglutathione hydrolase [Shewanella litorisediminis]
MLNIRPIPAFADNYIWMIELPDGGAVVVDPGEAGPVINTLQRLNLSLTAVLLTHHHGDHNGGISELRDWARANGQDFTVYGAVTSLYSDIPCRDGDTVEISGLSSPIRVLSVPGHTLDHLAFVVDNALFCGDTLFSGGCGRLFEGDASQLYDSLAKLSALSDDTRVYCAHEYTLSNLRFALAVEPHNQCLHDYVEQIKGLREANQPSLPSTLGTEKAINPFLRVNQAAVKTAVAQHAGQKVADEVTCLALLRRWKDNF